MTARRPRGVPELPVVGEQRQVEESLLVPLHLVAHEGEVRDVVEHLAGTFEAAPGSDPREHLGHR